MTSPEEPGKSGVEIRSEVRGEAGATKKPKFESSIAADLAHNLNRLKLWLALGKEHPEVVSMLVDPEKVEIAAQALISEDGDKDVKAKALEALGIHKEVEEDIEEKDIYQILGIDKQANDSKSAVKKNKLEKIIQIKIKDDKTITLDEAIDQLRGETNPDKKLVDEIKKRMEMLRDEYGVKEIKGMELKAEVLAAVDDRVNQLKAREDYVSGESLKSYKEDKTFFEVTFGKEVASKDGLVKVRADFKDKDKLEKVVERVRDNAAKDAKHEELLKLKPEELLSRFQDVNLLLENMSKLADYQLEPEDRRRLQYLLTSLQYQYQEQMAKRIATRWTGVENKSEEWGEVAVDVMRKVVNKNRKRLSQRVELKGKDSKEKFENLSKQVDDEGKKAVEKIKKAGYKSAKRSYENPRNEPDEAQWMRDRAWSEAEKLFDSVIGPDCSYNPFDDKDFWSDLSAPDDEGIDRIVDRAFKSGVKDKKRFREMLEKMRIGKDMLARPRYGNNESDRMGEGGLEIIKELMNYIAIGDYGAAANAMLEYTTRVGMQENSNDLQYIYVKRMFLAKVGVVSSDFAEQFQRNQAMNYLPGLTSQKPEDFYGTMGKVFAKGNTDLFFGDNAFMSANRIKFENGKEFVLSTKGILAALRSEKHQLKILNADPNTMDSTMQKIVIEELFGEGATLVLDEVDGKDILRLALPNQKKSEWKNIADIKVRSKFAHLDTRGYKGWENYTPKQIADLKKKDPSINLNSDGYEMSLQDVLNKDQWMMRNAVQFMWYSEMWMDTLKSYQPAMMQNTAKAILTAASAIADYKAQFELVKPPYLEVVQKIGDMLGPMERYKAADMVGKNVMMSILESLDREGMSVVRRTKLRDRAGKLGDLFKRVYVRQTEVKVNGTTEKVNNRIRSREMIKMAFNNLGEDDNQVGEIVRRRLLDMGMYPDDVPSATQLRKYYKDWKQIQEQGGFLEGKAGYMGQEYAAVWDELQELQMSGDDRDLWNSMTDEEFNVLVKMQEKLTGVDMEGVDRNNFWQKVEMEAFVDRAGTKHGDDWEQFSMKYSQGKIEALKIVIKIAEGAGTVEDYATLFEQLSLFATPEEKRRIMLILLDRQNLMTSEQWIVPYEIADIKKNAIGTSEIQWLSYKDSNGNEYFARTADGTRAYKKKMFRGNYARQVLGQDMWRPHDFELIIEYLRGKSVVGKEEALNMAEKILGTRRSVEYLAGGLAKRLGIAPEKMKGLVNIIAKGSSRLKLLALKTFLFDDPKWALWTLAQDMAGMGGKTFEHIFGFKVG